jgi:hypothetical protein
VWTGAAAYAPGAVGDAFSFSGSSYVEASPFAYTGAWTVQVWAKANVASQPKDYGLIGSGEPAAQANTFQFDWNTGGLYRFKAGQGTGAFTRNFGPASTSAFQHLVVTYDGVSAFTLYRDGVQVASGTYAGAAVFDVLKIGANRGENLRYNGVLDDVRVWSRALSGAEVSSIHGNGVNGVCD